MKEIILKIAISCGSVEDCVEISNFQENKNISQRNKEIDEKFSKGALKKYG